MPTPGLLGAVSTGEFSKVSPVIGSLGAVDTGEFSRPVAFGVLGYVNTSETGEVFGSGYVPPSGTSYSITTSGGVKVTGAAGKSFTFSGVSVPDGYNYVITPQGGVQLGSSATVSYSWTKYIVSGGVVVTGSAAVSTGNIWSGYSLAAKAPLVTGSFLLYLNTNSLNAKAPMPTGAFSLFTGRAGNLSGSLPLITGSFLGGTSYLAATLPAITGAFTGLTGIIGTLAAQAPRLTANFITLQPGQAVLAATTPVPRGAYTSLAGVAASLRGDLPALLGSYSGVAGTIARLNVEVVFPTAQFNGVQQISARLVAAVPRLKGRFAASRVATQIMTHVVDTVTNAVTMFDNYPYNSFAAFNGKYLAAGPSGLFIVDDEASTEAITATMTTAQLHFGSEYQKRVSDFYFAMRSHGDIILRVFTDENAPYEYVLSPHDIATLKQGKSLIGKGARGKYWQFQIEASEDFDFDTMNIAAVAVSRRV